MDLQQAIVGMVIAGATLYLGYTAWRSWKGRKTGCGGGCSCGKKEFKPGNKPGQSQDTVLIPLEQLTLRRQSPHSSPGLED